MLRDLDLAAEHSLGIKIQRQLIPVSSQRFPTPYVYSTLKILLGRHTFIIEVNRMYICEA